MNAEEIRNKNWTAYGNPLEQPVLVEIAAQLAEANEIRRLELECLNNLCGVVNLPSHEAGPLAKIAGSAESAAVTLDQLLNRQTA
jgi:hypothetical protein